VPLEGWRQSRAGRYTFGERTAWARKERRLLYVTSYIFRNSDMDDPVGDALALLVQLRNLFMFLLRIFMSARR
jgi:hypothetical protein